MNSVQIHMTEKLLNHLMQISRASIYKNMPLQFKNGNSGLPFIQVQTLWWKQNNTPSKWEDPLQLKLSSAPYPQTQLHASRFELVPADGAPHWLEKLTGSRLLWLFSMLGKAAVKHGPHRTSLPPVTVPFISPSHEPRLAVWAEPKSTSCSF